MKVELALRASKLKNVAGAFKGTSDPYAVVTHVATTPDTAPVVLGKTEVIENCLNPDWAKVIEFNYELGNPMRLIVSILDEVKKGDHKSMGNAVFDVGEILGARGNTVAKKLKNGSTIWANIRKSSGSGALRLKLKGMELKNTEGMFRKSDPFFEISRKIDSAGGTTWDNVYRSSVVRENLNPDWPEALIELSVLCGGNLDLPILFKIFDFESKGDHVPMGQFETSVNGLVEACSKGSSNAITITKSSKPSGKVIVVKAEVSGVESVTNQLSTASITAAATSTAKPTPVVAPKVPNFVDYVSGGCKFNLTVAIDFTGSNGDPRDPTTLHYIHRDGKKNDYEKALSAIIPILAKYDTDNMYPVLGFGAKYNGVVRHCFQCGPSEEVHGLDGVLNAYHQVFRSGLIMSGPTVFTEVIETAAARAISAEAAAAAKGEQVYTILLILTDGIVSDVGATAACLSQIYDAPLSVVIVGVGNEDFADMRFLDDLNKPGTRDIVQFVPFNNNKNSSVELTSATLNEIPNQLVGYFQRKGIAPHAPIKVRDEEVVVVPQEAEIDLSLDIKDNEIVVVGGGRDFCDALG